MVSLVSTATPILRRLDTGGTLRNVELAVTSGLPHPSQQQRSLIADSAQAVLSRKPGPGSGEGHWSSRPERTGHLRSLVTSPPPGGISRDQRGLEGSRTEDVAKTSLT